MVIIEEASPPPPSTHPWEHHVFLSFRGEDTRNNFTSHLYRALDQKGIITFMDDQLTRGEEISLELLKAIELSKISIVVFSKDYASSKWCLDELVKILDCKKSKQQIVLPVFFKVDPSDIRNQRGSFGEGLARLECKFKDNMEKIKEWKSALNHAATLSGWTISQKCSEVGVIQDIVEHILKLHKNIFTDMHVADYPVGMEPRVHEIHELLNVEGRDVHMVGIWGAGRIGKTTIAKAVYNSIAHKFEGSCVLLNVREASMGAGGFVELQKKLLCEILRKTLEVPNEARGINMIKERLQYKSVLLVLDDVSDKKQLANLAGDCKWFGKGSKIIITTRDKQLLASHRVDLIHRVQELAHDEALELFSHYAFNSNRPLVGYEELTESVLRYTQGLPLALTLLGSSLSNGNVEMWRAAIDGSESHEIKEVLQISYNLLNDELKAVFLDIACFFKGENREHVVKTLGACGRKHANVVIDKLIGKSLISIDEYKNRISMHDLVEEMGRDIVYRQSPDDPGRRSRLWFHEDVSRVLTENIGTNDIIGIKMELPADSNEICFSDTTFSNLRNLKLFIYRAGRYSGVVENVPKSLRVVDWPNCHLQFSASDLPRELVLLNMPNNGITVLGNRLEQMRNLTSLNLEGSQDLSGIDGVLHPLVTFQIRHAITSLRVSPITRVRRPLRSFGYLEHPITPIKREFHKMVINAVNQMRPINKELSLNVRTVGIKELHSLIEYCTSLEVLNLSRTLIRALPSSIGDLTSLRALNVSSTLIRELPSSIGNLTSLSQLNVSNNLIKELPSSIGRLTSLKELDASETLIEELPLSIGDLICLKCLKLKGCANLTNVPHSVYGGLKNLEELDLSSCQKLITFPSWPTALVSPSAEVLPPTLSTNLNDGHVDCGPLLFPSLRRLYLSGTSFDSVPGCISNFHKLESLDLGGCKNLRDLSELPYYIREINLDDCVSLERFPLLSNMLEQKDTLGYLRWMNLSNCHRLAENLGMNIVSKMAKALLDQLLSDGSAGYRHPDNWNIILPNLEGIEVPEWFYSGNVDTTVRPVHETKSSTCELLIKIPRTLTGKRIGLLVCAVFKITQNCSGVSDGFTPTFVINKRWYHGRHPDYRASNVRKLSGHDDVCVCLACIDFKVDDHEVRVIFDSMMYVQGAQWFSLRSFGVHLADMQQIDDDHVSGEDLALDIYRPSNAGISDFESEEGAAIASVVSDDSNSGEQQQEEQESHLQTTRLEDLGRQTHMGRAMLSFLRCFGITCL